MNTPLLKIMSSNYNILYWLIKPHKLFKLYINIFLFLNVIVFYIYLHVDTATKYHYVSI